MRKISAVFVAAVVMILAVIVAQAANVLNTTVPFSEPISPTCNGDTVTLTGTEYEVIDTTVNGNTAHASGHVHVHAEGIGAPSGTQYILDATIFAEENVDIDPTTQTGEATIVADATLVAQGSAPNEKVQLVAHMTVNADGTVTVDRTEIEDNCQ